MTSPVAALPQIARSWKAQFTNATGTNPVTIITPSASYSWAKVVGLIATLSDTVAATMTWGISRGGILYVISTVVIPAGAGFSSVPINLMSSTLSPGLPIDADGAPYLFLEQANGDTLVGQLTSAVSSGKVLNVNAIGGEY